MNNSKNIIFCGTTSNYNLTSLMEKRIRSRFSQKTFFLDLISRNDIDNTLKLLIAYDEDNNQNYRNVLLYELFHKNEMVEDYIEKSFSFGVSIKEIFFILKVFFSNVLQKITRKERINESIESSKLQKIFSENWLKLMTVCLPNLEFLYSKIIK